MAIFRVEKNENYSVIANYHFKEKNMSLKAKGLLSLMLSLPDNWDYSIAGLVALSKDGKDSVVAALNELEQFGYLRREMIKNEKGQFMGCNYTVYEMPITEKQHVEEPKAENPQAGNQLQLNTKELNTKELNTKKINTNNNLDNLITTFDFSETTEEELTEALKDFEEMRKKIKKPLTDRAKKGIIKKLYELSGGNASIAVEILDNSIMNSWQGVFELKQEPKKQQQAAATSENEYPF